MTKPDPIPVNRLYRECDLSGLDFRTTDDLTGLDIPVGQDRLMQALEFGIGMRAPDFNIYLMSDDGINHDVVTSLLREKAASKPAPPDYCYRFNFDTPNRPVLMTLPHGTAHKLKTDLQKLVSELRSEIPAIFETEEYRNRLHELQQQLAERQGAAIETIQKSAEAEDIALLATASGFTLAPRKNGEVLDMEAFNALPEDERKRIESAVQRIEKELQATLQQFPLWRREAQTRIRELNEEMVMFAAGNAIQELKGNYSDCEPALTLFESIQRDLSENVDAFLDSQSGMPVEQLLQRYQLNVLVDNANQAGAPIIYEDLPNIPKLLGRIEHHVRQGALLTDFTLIRAGALHRANGGYLILDLRKLLFQPLAWDSLKRALSARQLRIESLEQLYSMMSTVSLEPEPIPLDAKIVLIGNRRWFYLLSQMDPDFDRLFKVQADFADDIPRDDNNVAQFARHLAAMIRHLQLHPFARDALARVIEHASRLADDNEKLLAQADILQDLLSEADYWAAQADSAIVEASHVQHAIDQRLYRADRINERMGEAIARGILFIATEGAAVGQINGLTVFQLGGHRFGRPARITATARLGKGQVLDIEREVKLGGAIHAKAILILSRFLGSYYARERALALSASLAFEQSYGQIEGDSASVAETCALLSAISGIPLHQGFAVTGSINQHGEVQPVGGVNEKIEGFFDVCKERGFAQPQGVIIPRTNLPHLMLRRDVRDAVEAGGFQIYAVDRINEALELLTGVTAGEPQSDGSFPDDSFNSLVQRQLEAFATLQKQQGLGEERSNVRRNED